MKLNLQTRKLFKKYLNYSEEIFVKVTKLRETTW